MPNWRLMIEILWHSNVDQQINKNNNRGFKCIFVAIDNVQLWSIQSYNIDNTQDWRI